MSDREIQQKSKKDIDPEHYRMTIGEHLEELRIRMILGLLGLGLAAIVCLIFGEDVMLAFCRPLIDVLQQYSINPQIYFTQMADPFLVYIKISLISAAAISSPWILYQLWLFVASGLYSHERHVVTKYVPLSITLLISGMLFVYFLVLPWTLQFFLAFSINIPFPQPKTPTAQVSTTQPSMIEVVPGNPKDLAEGQVWIDSVTGRMKVNYANKIRVIPFGPETLTSPMITLPDYIDLVFGMLLTFGLSFQLPLVVMALVAVGIVDRAAIKQSRRYVYFIMAIVAAIITPGDVITATIALMIPLCLLFELGIWLSRAVSPVTEDELESDR